MCCSSINQVAKSVRIGVGIVAWAGLLAAGLRVMHRHEREASPQLVPPSVWPGATPFVPGTPHLVMAVHPRCPCTRLSLESLGDLLADASRENVVNILLYRPRDSAADWSRDMKVPRHSAVIDDPGGQIAYQFGLSTSGEVAAFDASGQLVYAGGITSGRSRTDACVGRETVREILRGEAPTRDRGLVFGCDLDNAGRAPLRERTIHDRDRNGS